MRSKHEPVPEKRSQAWSAPQPTLSRCLPSSKFLSLSLPQSLLLSICVHPCLEMEAGRNSDKEMSKDIRVFLECTRWWRIRWTDVIWRKGERETVEREWQKFGNFSEVQDLFFWREECLVSEIFKLFSCKVQPLFSDCVRFSDFTEGGGWHWKVSHSVVSWC